MTALEWDKIGERLYEAGVDRGVLYLPDSSGAYNEAHSWNGLTSVEEAPNQSSNSYYQDGVKYLENVVIGDYAGTLKAFTYPDAFDAVQGIGSGSGGMYVHNQKPKLFGLSYRTRIGNDLEGIDHGYRIHLLYNLIATPSNAAYSSVSNSPSPLEFQWNLSGTPGSVTGWKPTAHLSIKSTDLDPGYLAFVEEVLYGNEVNDPRLPSLNEMFDLVANRLTIVDNGDGSWTASGSPQAVDILGNGAFILNGASSTDLGDGEYEITIPVY